MRVIAGKLRGARLAVAPGSTTRPITDQVKESLFNILGHRFGTLGELPAVAVLDLFAGSGALGIESLSRGAASCLFVEKDRAALRALRGNLERLRLHGRVRVAAENVWTMRVPPAATGGFGLIFVDPPYRATGHGPMVAALLERLAQRLAPEGILVLRCSRETTFTPSSLRGLVCVDQRDFGRMRIFLLERPASAGGEGEPGPSRITAPPGAPAS
jgi:16S rRNA (guanine966-N2)-methyltransferase